MERLKQKHYEFVCFLKKCISLLKHQYQLSEKELKILIKWSTPLIVSNLLNNVSYLFVNLIFVGQNSPDELAGAALSNTWTYCTMSLGTGLANAMDTLVSQSFGANNLTLVGLTLQRASIISSAAFLIVGALWAITEYFLLLVQQDAAVSAIAFQYSIHLLPGLWFYLQTNCLQKYLQCQGVMWPSIVVGLIMNAFNVLFNYILVKGVGDYEGMGYKGSALATSISRIISFFVMLAVIKIWNLHKETWFGWQKECLSLNGFKEYLRLGGPASIQHASEAVGFEVLTILAGLIGPGTIALDAHSVTYNFTMLTYQFPSGISIATSVRVGQLLGSKNEAMAKRVSWLAFGMALIFMGIIAIIQYTCRHVIGYIYVSDPEVVAQVAKLLVASAVFQLFDGGQTIFQGVVRGMGRVVTGAVCNFIAFYVISIPLSAVLAFPLKVGVIGLWWGLCVGLVTICVVLIVIILKVDWTSEVDKAIQRTKSVVLQKEDLENQMIQLSNIQVATDNPAADQDGDQQPQQHHHHHHQHRANSSNNISTSGMALTKDDGMVMEDSDSDSIKNNDNSDDDDINSSPAPKQQNGKNNKMGGSVRASRGLSSSGSNVDPSTGSVSGHHQHQHHQHHHHHNNAHRESYANRANSSPDFRSNVPDPTVNRCHPQ